mgnify:FL=1
MASSIRKEIQDFGGEGNIDVLIAEVDKLVTIPNVYYQLESLIEQPNSALRDFAQLLGTDTDLCARLISMANSAFYSFPASIETVDKAVQIIGIRQIRELVLATSVVKAFSQMPLGMVDMNSFWKHSVAVSVLAKSIGQYCHLSQPERFYVSGLLHDIGRLVFYLKLPDLMRDLLIQREAKEEILFVLESEMLGYNHAEVGGRLLQNWRIPMSIYEPVCHHHSPVKSLEFTAVTAAVHVADVWVNKHQMGSSGERFAIPLDQFAMQQLKLEMYELDEIWTLAEDEINEIYGHFSAQ